MRKSVLTLFLSTLALIMAPSITRAAIFDAPDYMEPGHYSLGAYGEFLLNNPSGEGIELRGKRGLSEGVNLEPLIGFGTRNRGFRLGVANTVNFFPNTDRQPGISLLSTVQYVKRETQSGLNVTVAPLVNKIVDGVDHQPLNLYLAFPYYVELYSGHYKTGLQAAFGGLYDVDKDGAYYLVSEAGISLNNAESLVLVGGGIRFDSDQSHATHAVHYTDDPKKDREEPKPNVTQTKSVDEDEDYAPEDKK